MFEQMNFSVTAAEDLSTATGQFLCIAISSSGAARQVTRGGRVVGVLLNTPTSGTPASIGSLGIQKVQVGSTHAIISPGFMLYSSTAATALSTADGSSLTYYHFGVSLDYLAADTSGFVRYLPTLTGAGTSSGA